MQAAQRLVTRELGPFVEMDVGGDVLAKTNSRPEARVHPVWNEAFVVDVCHDLSEIKLKVRSISAPSTVDRRKTVANLSHKPSPDNLEQYYTA